MPQVIQHHQILSFNGCSESHVFVLMVASSTQNCQVTMIHVFSCISDDSHDIGALSCPLESHYNTIFYWVNRKESFHLGFIYRYKQWQITESIDFGFKSTVNCIFHFIFEDRDQVINQGTHYRIRNIKTIWIVIMNQTWGELYVSCKQAFTRAYNHGISISHLYTLSKN